MPPIWKRDESDEEKGGRHGKRRGVPCTDDICFFFRKYSDEEEDRTMAVAVGGFPGALEEADGVRVVMAVTLKPCIKLRSSATDWV